MTLSANFTSKSVFNQQGCRVLTFALARLSCNLDHYSYYVTTVTTLTQQLAAHYIGTVCDS